MSVTARPPSEVAVASKTFALGMPYQDARRHSLKLGSLCCTSDAAWFGLCPAGGHSRRAFSFRAGSTVREVARGLGGPVSSARPVGPAHPLAASSSQSRCRCTTARCSRRSRRHRRRARRRAAWSESRDEPSDRGAAREQPPAHASGFEHDSHSAREPVTGRGPAPDRGAIALTFAARGRKRACRGGERDGFAADYLAHDLGQFVWGH